MPDCTKDPSSPLHCISRVGALIKVKEQGELVIKTFFIAALATSKTWL